MKRIVYLGVLCGGLFAIFVAGFFMGQSKQNSLQSGKPSTQEAQTASPVAHELAPDDRERPAERIIESVLLNLDLVTHNLGQPIEGAGGGLAVAEDGVLIARSQTGRLFFYDKNKQALHRIKLALPDNGFATLPARVSTSSSISAARHRYNDIAFIKRGPNLSLLVSYTQFHFDRDCSTNRVAYRELESDWNAPDKTDLPTELRDGWEVVFETKPCIPVSDPDYPNIQPFSAHEAGGRIAVGSDGILYLTVGGFGFKGEVERRKKRYSLKPGSDYGKIIRIDPKDWSAVKVSSGHKNPQGITLDNRNRIWSVEHGPQGGDELNLIEPGFDYGWPHETFGVRVRDGGDDKYSYSDGRHDNFRQPAFAWLPSIGVSNLKQVTNFHGRWDGDLVAASLRASSLHRIRMDGDRVLYVEQIPLGKRVRYVGIGKDELYLLFDDGHFATLRPRPTSRLKSITKR